MVSDGGAPAEANTRLKITATTNGPLLAEGTLMLRSSRGSGCYASSVVELCRCGGSSNKPFCDGTHERIGFRS
jgi:CDGSH-type Zn-finger protein